MFTCRDLVRHADAYLDGDLPALSRFRIRLHLLICRNCRRYLEQLRQTLALLGPAFTDESMIGMEEELIGRFLQKHGGES